MEKMIEERKIEAIYPYTDENGNLLYEVVRFKPKGFCFRRPDGNGGYIYNINGVRKVPYNLRGIINSHPDDEIYITEGEKDANSIIAEGFVSTCNPGGAGKWLPEFSEVLRNRLVRITQDNDDAGKRHARTVAESLCGIAKSVKILDLTLIWPQLPAKGDVSDLFDAGFKRGHLAELVDATEEYKEEKWTRKADVVRMSEIEPEDVQWLWPGRIPQGMITLIVGDPDLGKSYMSLYCASTVSKGANWPDGTTCPQAQSLILNAEDALACTVRKRLQLLESDPEKIIAIRSMMERHENGKSIDHFNLVDDLPHLENVLKENPEVRLVIIDPLSAYFGKADTFKESTVRSILSPLAYLANRYNVAMVCIMHLNKGNSNKAMYRTQGSLAFPATARVVWLVSNDPEDPESKRRFLINMKFNIGDKPNSLAFEIIEGKFRFENEPAEITSSELFAGKGGIEAPERNRAIEWLKEIFSEGRPIPSKEIFEMAKQEEFNKKTLQRARKEIGIKCYIECDDENNRVWYWRMPDNEQMSLADLQNAQQKSLDKVNQMMKKMKI